MKKLLILMLILTFASSTQAVVFQDNFDHITQDDWSRIDYEGWYEQTTGVAPYPGGPWTIGDWDGYMSIPDGEGSVKTIYAYNYVNMFNYGMGEYDDTTDPDKVAWLPMDPGGELNGVLSLMSTGGGFEHAMNTGPFLFKEVEGNFEAYVEIVGQHYTWHNLGGLMARAPNGDEFVTADQKITSVGGPGIENSIALVYFPTYDFIGNQVRDTVGGATSMYNKGGFPCDPYLKLVRQGNLFSFYLSADGVTYNPFMVPDAIDPNIMVPLVIEREMPSVLEVGIMQGNFTGDWLGPMQFDNFVLIPEPATIALLGLGGLALIRRKR